MLMEPRPSLKLLMKYLISRLVSLSCAGHMSIVHRNLGPHLKSVSTMEKALATQILLDIAANFSTINGTHTVGMQYKIGSLEVTPG